MINPNCSFRIQFVKRRVYRRFIQRLTNDNILSQFVADIDKNSVLFTMSNESTKDEIFNTFKDKLSARVKYTKAGFKYLKIY